MTKNVKNLGQVFTSDDIVNLMLGLIKNKGNILEPSCGDGAFLKKLNRNKTTALEIDSAICPSKAINIDFFDYDTNNKFKTIIGNPPYVRYKNILDTTKEKLDMKMFDERTNLSLFFMGKAIEHLDHKGELIFIVPRDFTKASSAVKFNNMLYKLGTITHLIDFGDKVLFKGYSPNCVIFRFQKDNFTRKTLINGIDHNFKNINGQLIFSQNDYPINFNDLFFVKVGAVSGLDKVFEHEDGNQEFVCSETRDNGQTRKMIYNKHHAHLDNFKDTLLNRKIKMFKKHNWYMWGRNYFESDLPRIYVNTKTRKTSPFFIHDCKAYDGSVLAIFPKVKMTKKELKNACEELNCVNWADLGFICDGRYIFSQRSLEKTKLPEVFKKFKK